ncbi:hypothetical protein FDECE_3043 [Fusarium decemcellulare]|nr:hypothetical protein FDECE_3043 [Fusarium decemcellulare]
MDAHACCGELQPEVSNVVAAFIAVPEEEASAASYKRAGQHHLTIIKVRRGQASLAPPERGSSAVSTIHPPRTIRSPDVVHLIDAIQAIEVGEHDELDKPCKIVAQFPRRETGDD